MHTTWRWKGRLTHPMRYDAAQDRYVETTWDVAFKEEQESWTKVVLKPGMEH